MSLDWERNESYSDRKIQLSAQAEAKFHRKFPRTCWFDFPSLTTCLSNNTNSVSIWLTNGEKSWQFFVFFPRIYAHWRWKFIRNGSGRRIKYREKLFFSTRGFIIFHAVDRIFSGLPNFCRKIIFQWYLLEFLMKWFEK